MSVDLSSYKKHFADNAGKYIVDVVGLIGVGVVGHGIWQIYPPAAFIFIGVTLMTIAVLITINGGK